MKVRHKSITISQIAKEANVSITTVSRVFNGTNLEKVGMDTRHRVEAVIKKYGYKPNVHAKGLAIGKTGFIGVQILSFTQPLYYVEILDSIIKYAGKKGYGIILGVSNWKHKEEIDSINAMLEKGVDGLIWQPIRKPSERTIKDIQKKNRPIVWLNKDCGFNIPSSCNDEIKSGRLAAEYLVSKGCLKPIFVGLPDDVHTNMRLEGWSTFLSEKNISYQCVLHPVFKKYNRNYRPAWQLFDELFQTSKRGEFDGMFISGSHLCYIANDVLSNSPKLKNYKIPIITHDMIPIYPGRYILPTILPDYKRIGMKSVDILLRLINGRKTKSVISLPLVVADQKIDYLS